MAGTMVDTVVQQYEANTKQEGASSYESREQGEEAGSEEYESEGSEGTSSEGSSSEESESASPSPPGEQVIGIQSAPRSVAPFTNISSVASPPNVWVVAGSAGPDSTRLSDVQAKLANLAQQTIAPAAAALANVKPQASPAGATIRAPAINTSPQFAVANAASPQPAVLMTGPPVGISKTTSPPAFRSHSPSSAPQYTTTRPHTTTSFPVTNAQPTIFPSTTTLPPKNVSAPQTSTYPTHSSTYPTQTSTYPTQTSTYPTQTNPYAGIPPTSAAAIKPYQHFPNHSMTAPSSTDPTRSYPIHPTTQQPGMTPGYHRSDVPTGGAGNRTTSRGGLKAPTMSSPPTMYPREFVPSPLADLADVMRDLKPLEPRVDDEATAASSGDLDVKNRGITDSTESDNDRRFSSEDGKWSTDGKWILATRSGPTPFPEHVLTKHPEFPQGEVPSPFTLYYFDETAPNRVLLANDVEQTDAARNMKRMMRCAPFVATEEKDPLERMGTLQSEVTFGDSVSGSTADSESYETSYYGSQTVTDRGNEQETGWDQPFAGVMKVSGTGESVPSPQMHQAARSAGDASQSRSMTYGTGATMSQREVSSKAPQAACCGPSRNLTAPSRSTTKATSVGYSSQEPAYGVQARDVRTTSGYDQSRTESRTASRPQKSGSRGVSRTTLSRTVTVPTKQSKGICGCGPDVTESEHERTSGDRTHSTGRSHSADYTDDSYYTYSYATSYLDSVSTARQAYENPPYVAARSAPQVYAMNPAYAESPEVSTTVDPRALSSVMIPTADTTQEQLSRILAQTNPDGTIVPGMPKKLSDAPKYSARDRSSKTPGSRKQTDISKGASQPRGNSSVRRDQLSQQDRGVTGTDNEYGSMAYTSVTTTGMSKKAGGICCGGCNTEEPKFDFEPRSISQVPTASTSMKNVPRGVSSRGASHKQSKPSQPTHQQSQLSQQNSQPTHQQSQLSQQNSQRYQIGQYTEEMPQQYSQPIQQQTLQSQQSEQDRSHPATSRRERSATPNRSNTKGRSKSPSVMDRGVTRSTRQMTSPSGIKKQEPGCCMPADNAARDISFAARGISNVTSHHAPQPPTMPRSGESEMQGDGSVAPHSNHSDIQQMEAIPRAFAETATHLRHATESFSSTASSYFDSTSYDYASRSQRSGTYGTATERYVTVDEVTGCCGGTRKKRRPYYPSSAGAGSEMISAMQQAPRSGPQSSAPRSRGVTGGSTPYEQQSRQPSARKSTVARDRSTTYNYTSSVPYSHVQTGASTKKQTGGCCGGADEMTADSRSVSRMSTSNAGAYGAQARGMRSGGNASRASSATSYMFSEEGGSKKRGVASESSTSYASTYYSTTYTASSYAQAAARAGGSRTGSMAYGDSYMGERYSTVSKAQPKTGMCGQEELDRSYDLKKFFFEADNIEDLNNKKKSSSTAGPGSKGPMLTTSLKNYPIICYDVVEPKNPSEFHKRRETPAFAT